MMRCNRILIRDVPALMVALDRIRPTTLVVDVEPLVVPWDSAPTLFPNAPDDFAQTVQASVPSVTSVVYSSNSRCPRTADSKPDIRIVTAACKPWRTRYLHDEPGPVAVVGDQVLTDGLLAWRLGATFLHWQVTVPMPRWPRLQRCIGRIAAPSYSRMTMAPRRKQTSPLPTAKLNGDAAKDSERLQVLLEDYSQGRDDERNWNTVLASLIAVAFTLIGLLVAAVTQTCRFNTSNSCTHVPDYLIGATPLLPIALLMFTQILGTVATFRVFYLRAVEAEIQQYAGAPLKSISPILPASYIDMTTELTSLRRGRLQYRIVTFLLVATIIVVFGGFACYIALHMDLTTQIVMAVVYAPIVLLMVSENYTAGPGGRSMFYKIAERYIAHRYTAGYALDGIASYSPRPKRGKRSLLSYLLMPRVAEWVKWVITPGAFVVTAWATGSFGNWHQFILI